MDANDYDQRLKRIERRVQLLIGLAIAQLACSLGLLGWVIASSMMPNTLTLVLLLVAVAAFAYFFRSQIPGWFGRFSRWLFAQFLTAQEHDSVKDSVK